MRLSYSDLLSDPDALRTQIERAFGSEEGCLGIILIDGESDYRASERVTLMRKTPGLPEPFTSLRESLFNLAYTFASLPEEVRESLTRPETMYSFGWSHGKEVMNGVGQLTQTLKQTKLRFR